MKVKKAVTIFVISVISFCYMSTMVFADVVTYTTEGTVKVTNLPKASLDAVDASASSMADMPKEGFWSTLALKTAVSNGLLNGFIEGDGTYIKPNDPLTRAQMATIVNRAFGSKETASLSVVSDVSANEWYFKEMQKAVKMGIMRLDTNMRPNHTVTRQEAFTVIGRALNMNDGVKADLSKFRDASQVADWATQGMGAMVKAGYIEGDNNLLSPTANMTRAQFAVIMNDVIKQYITNSGTVTEVASGNVMINIDGVVLENVIITGDLIIGDGVGDGTVTLKNVIVNGNLVSRVGGVDSIVITGGSIDGRVIIVEVNWKIKVPSGYERVMIANNDETAQYMALTFSDNPNKNPYIDIEHLKTLEEFGTKNEGGVDLYEDENILEFFMIKSTGTVTGAIDGPSVGFKMDLNTNEILEKEFISAPEFPNPEQEQLSGEVLEIPDDRLVEIGLYFKDLFDTYL